MVHGLAAAAVVATCDPQAWDETDIDPPSGAGAQLFDPWRREDPEEPDPLSRILAWLARILRI